MPRGSAFLLFLAVALISTLVSLSARADTLQVVNQLRSGSCQPAGVKARGFRSSSALNDVAERIAKGASLRDALAAARYRARATRSLSASGVSGDSALGELAARKFCSEIAESSLTEIGSVRRGDRVWIILAEPFSAPALAHPASVAADILSLVNAARAASRRCGAQAFAAVPALELSPELTKAAAAHAADLTHRDRLTHEGSDASDPGIRATRAGYRWLSIGENIAAGPESAQQVVAGWLASPAHCANIMDGRFTQMGIAYEVDWGTKEGIYWVQEFGRPR